MPTPAPAISQPLTGIPVDVTRRFVRITAERGAFVEFDFAIGWPELSVELVLPRPAFEAFCRRNAVILLTDEPATPSPATPEAEGDPEDDD